MQYNSLVILKTIQGQNTIRYADIDYFRTCQVIQNR